MRIHRADVASLQEFLDLHYEKPKPLRVRCEYCGSYVPAAVNCPNCGAALPPVPNPDNEIILQVDNGFKTETKITPLLQEALRRHRNARL